MMKSYQEVITESLELLTHIENPKFEAESLLAFVLQCNRSRVIAFPEERLTKSQYAHYKTLLDQRIKGVPFAYLTGEKEFYDLTLKVSPATLIPRADTELLVDTALSKMVNDHAYHMIDMGTGTGAIALTIKKHRPSAHVMAVDQSLEAIKIAQENGKNLKLDVTFIQSDWFSKINENESFDFILSNPPYIATYDEHLMGDGVKFEPLSALIAEDHGYADLFYLIEHSLLYLKCGGWLMLEHGFEQGEKLRDKFFACHYKNIATLKDLSGHDRITVGKK